MIAEVLELFKLWRNPVFRRFCRSRLRLRKAVFWYLLTLIVTTFVVTLIYIIRTNTGVSEQNAARSLWIPVLIIQGLIMFLKGTGSVSAGLIQDKLDQTLDYQRLTPVSPIKNLLGYLFGLPIMEYTMVALTLPHLAFIVVVGDIPLSALASVYLVFFTCTILYHVSGIAVGMVMQKWIWGYLLSILMVVFLNLILPGFISQLGLKFFQYLSIWPVIGQELLPLIVSASALSRVATQNPFFSMADAVPFFNWELSPFLFTLLLQSALIATFATMALRRWKSLTMHSLSKLYALSTLCGFIVLILGNLWPAITGRGVPFALFGAVSVEQLSQGVVMSLPLVYCLFVWLLCLILFSMVVPSHHSYIRGIRRAMKLGRQAAHPWDDDSANLLFMGLFVVAALLGFWILFYELSASGFFDVLAEVNFNSWRLPVVLGLVVFYTILLLQVMELRYATLSILLLWFLPILVATVISASREDFHTLQSVIASISPLALIIMSGMLPLATVFQEEAGPQYAALLTGISTGLMFIVMQIVWLWRRWHKLKGAYYRSCQGARPQQEIAAGRLQAPMTTG